MEKECCRCRHFTAYFTKAYCCYLRTDCGNCSTRGETVNKHSSCENWEYKIVKKNLKYSVIINCLADAITNISVIKDFLDAPQNKPQ